LYTDGGLATAKGCASKAEDTVAVVGEEVYEEKSGDINDDLTLPLGQIDDVKELAATRAAE
jgi:beta-glucosidase